MSIGPFGTNIAISYVTGGSVCGTAWGNTIIGTSGNGQWGIEIGAPNVSVEQNMMTNVDAPFFVGAAPGTDIANNTMTNFSNNPPYYDYAFNKDGGYNATEWIGYNVMTCTRFGLNNSSVLGWPTGNGGPASPISVPFTLCEPSAPYK